MRRGVRVVTWRQRVAAGLASLTVISCWGAGAPVVGAAGGPSLSLDVTWTRPGDGSLVHRAPESVRVGDTVRIAPTVANLVATNCVLTTETDRDGQGSMTVTRFGVPGDTDVCPLWTYVLPDVDPGPLVISGQVNDGEHIATVRVTLTAAAGMHRPFTSDPAALSWDDRDVFGRSLAIGTPLTLAWPTGMTTCFARFNLSGPMGFDSPSTSDSCAPWSLVLPETRPWPLSLPKYGFVQQGSLLLQGGASTDANTRGSGFVSVITVDMTADGDTPAASDRPFVYFDPAVNPYWVTAGTWQLVPTVLNVASGICSYQVRLTQRGVTTTSASETALVDGACVPVSFTLGPPDENSPDQIDGAQVGVTIRDSEGRDIVMGWTSSTLVFALPPFLVSAPSSVVAGAPLAVSATLNGGAPVAFSTTATMNSTTAPSAATKVTCTGGSLDPRPGKDVVRSVCRLPAAGRYTIRLSVRDGAGNVVSGTRIVTVRPDRVDPTAKKPVVRVAGTVGKSVPVTVSLRGSDVGTGIDHFQIDRQVVGGRWVRISSTAAGSRLATHVGAGRPFRFRVRAIDRAGNVGAWVAGGWSSVRLAQETAATFTSAWHHSASPEASGGSAETTATSGSRGRFRFSGRAVAIVASRDAGLGSLHLWIDGRDAGTVSLAAARSDPRSVVWTRAVTGGQTHTLTFAAQGAVNVDAFVVLR